MRLRELTVISDELLALSRAGFPLHKGLQLSKRQTGRRIRELSEKLGRRLESGQSLSRALQDPDARFPPVFAAVLEVGEKSGDLTGGLETVTELSQRMLQLRRFVNTSLIYPLLTLLLATALAVAILPAISEQLLAVYAELRVDATTRNVQFLRWLGFASGYLWTVPLVIVVALGLRLFYLRVLRPDTWNSLTGPAAFVPGCRKMVRSVEQQLICEATARLLKQQIPIPDALTLAANVIGQPAQRAQAHHLAERIRSGDLRNWSPQAFPALPTQLVWALQCGTSCDDAATMLLRAARLYDQQRQRREMWMRTYFPILCLGLLGGWVMVVFIFSFFVPWTHLLYDLSRSAMLDQGL